MIVKRPDWLIPGDLRSGVRADATAAFERSVRRDRRAGFFYRAGSLIQSGALWAEYGVLSLPRAIRRRR